MTIGKCIACLEENSINSDQLCEFHALHNDSVDGTLLALLRAEEDTQDE